MKEFEELLDEYGLKIKLPNEPQFINESLFKTEEETGFQQMCSMLDNGMRIVVGNIEKVMLKMEVNEDFESIKQIIEEFLAVHIWTDRGWGHPEVDLISLISYENLILEMEKRFLEEPEKYGYEQNELKLKEMFDKEFLRSQIESKIDAFYDLLEDEDAIEMNRSKFVFELEDALEGQKFTEEWLKEKMKNSSFKK